MKEENREILTKQYILTEEQIIAAFTEWDRLYREEPDRFASQVQMLLRETPESYGQKASRTFLFFLKENANNLTVNERMTAETARWRVPRLEPLWP